MKFASSSIILSSTKLLNWDLTWDGSYKSVPLPTNVFLWSGSNRFFRFFFLHFNTWNALGIEVIIWHLLIICIHCLAARRESEAGHRAVPPRPASSLGPFMDACLLPSPVATGYSSFLCPMRCTVDLFLFTIELWTKRIERRRNSPDALTSVKFFKSYH